LFRLYESIFPASAPLSFTLFFFFFFLSLSFVVLDFGSFQTEHEPLPSPLFVLSFFGSYRLCKHSLVASPIVTCQLRSSFDFTLSGVCLLSPEPCSILDGHESPYDCLFFPDPSFPVSFSEVLHDTLRSLRNIRAS